MGTLKRSWWLATLMLASVAAGCGTRVDQAAVPAGLRPTSTPAAENAGDSAAAGTPESPASALPSDAPATAPAVAGTAGIRVPQPPGGPATPSPAARPAPQTSGAGERTTSPSPGPAQEKPPAPTGTAVPLPVTGDVSPIVIGSVGNYSGPAGAAQYPGAQALQVWAKLTNTRGGIDGHAVRVIVADDGGDPARHFAAVRDLTENKSVIAFVAQYASLTHQAAASYLADKRIPVVGGEVSLTLWNENPMYFPQSAATEHAAFGRVHAARRFAKGTRLAGLFCVEAQVCKDFERFVAEDAPQVGFKLVYSGRGSLGQPDFTAECLQAKNAAADVLFAIFDLNSVRRIAASCTRQGYHPQYVLALGTGDLTSQDEPAFEGAMASVPSFPFVGADSPAIREYLDAFARFAPDLQLSPVGGHGWAAAKLFEKAARSIGPAKPTTKAILDGLWSLRDETLGGLTVPLTFERDKPAPKSRCWFVMQIVNHRWTAPDGDRVTCR